MEKSLLKEVLKRVKEYLPAEELIITGSTAMELIGFDLPKRLTGAQDVDLVIINPSNDTVEMLKKAMKLIPAETKPIDDEYDELQKTKSLIAIMSLVVDDKTIKVDIFRESESYQLSDLMFGGYKIASVQSIVKAKRSYARPKDFKDLSHYGQTFFDFKNFIIRSFNNIGIEH